MASRRTETPAMRGTTGHQCYFLCQSDGLSVADVAQGFGPLEYGLWLFLAVASRGAVVAYDGALASCGASSPRATAGALGGFYRESKYPNGHARQRRWF